MDYALLLEFMGVGVIALAIGFFVTHLLKTCKKKKHELFYLMVLATFLLQVYYLFIDTDVISLRQNVPEVYYTSLISTFLIFAFLYSIYVWSSFSYIIIAALIILNALFSAYTLSLAIPHITNTQFMVLQTDFIFAIFQDFFKFGLLLGAKYKFLK